MRKSILILFLFFTLMVWANPISNVRAYQEGMKIVLLYDLSKPAYVQKVSIEVNGKIRKLPVSSLSGDVNREVKGGVDRRIVYDVLSDYTEGLHGEVTFYIETNSTQDIVVYASHSSERIYARSATENTFSYKGVGTWNATNLNIGTYYIKRERVGWEDQYDTIAVQYSSTSFKLKPMRLKMGTISVSSSPSQAAVYIDGKKVGITPWVGEVSAGEHTVRVEKDGRLRSDTRTLSVAQNAVRTENFRLKREWSNPSDDHPNHYLEPMYAYDYWYNKDHYAGLRYAWIPNRFGLDVTAMYGIYSTELSATLGPTFRLTRLSSPLSLQLALGGGAMYRFSDHYITYVGDAALRFGFREKYEDHKFGWWSFSLGARYYDHRVMPTASISLMPVRALTLAAVAMEDFPCIYLEAQCGYQFQGEEFLMGGQLSYIPSHLGVGSSFLVGLNGGWDVTAGPILRLTPDYIALDLQVYQGFGYGRYNYDSYNQTNGFLAETNLRFAFGHEKPYFGLWSFNVGCVYGRGTTVVTCGFSLPIVGIAGIIAGGVAGAVYAKR